jgi:hypothetical protein
MESLIKMLNMYRDKWVSAKRLSFWLGVNERMLRDMVVEAIDKGHLIASGNQGYMLTEKWSLIEASIRRIEAHSISQLQRCRKLRANAKQGQLDLFKAVV